MNNNLLKETDLSDILDNIGIAYIYELKRGIINKLKGPQDYYEIKNVDIGFSPIDDMFVSLKEEPGKCFLIGHDYEENQFAIDFKSILEVNDNPKILSKYEAKIGQCFLFDSDTNNFKKITDSHFLANKKKKQKKNIRNLDILGMYEKIKQTIVAQDEQVKQILASVYKNQKIINSSLDDETVSKLKENIIVYGPTGTGKTEILTQIAKLCDVPIVIEDVTSFSETGYVGRDVSDMLSDLYSMSGMNIDLAQKGILVIDEFDKIADGGLDSGTEGPSRNGVQRSLLKLLDGGTITFREDNYDGNLIEFNTSKLTIVALGAFSGIKKNNDYSDISIKDFTDYGIIREVMGRFSKLVSMNSFSKDDIKKILLESNLSPINTYKKLFAELGIDFTYDENLIDYIAEESMALDCGARSLKTVFDGIISDALFDIFAEKKTKIHLTIPADKSKSYVAKKRASENRNTIGFC